MEGIAPQQDLTSLALENRWNSDEVLGGRGQAALEQALAATIPSRRWYGSKSRRIAGVEIVDAVAATESVRLLIVRIRFASGGDEVYHVPLAMAAGETPAGVRPWIQVRSADGKPLGVLHDALDDETFCQRLLALFESPAELAGREGAVVVDRTGAFDEARGDRTERLPAQVVAAEQSNSSVIFGRRMIMKIFRRIETGLNPDFEISAFLTRRAFASTPALAGTLEYRQPDAEPWALAMLQEFVPNRGDAWKFTLDWLAAAIKSPAPGESNVVPPEPEHGVLQAAEEPIPLAVRAAFGEFLTSAERLAQRTAEMHLALASDSSNVDFAPQPFTEQDRRAFFGRASEQARETFEMLQEHLPNLSGDVARQAKRVVKASQSALDRYAVLADAGVAVDKIRIHGDYHLGQVLATDDDFMIIDFEGEPVRSIRERRQKQLALRDVAGMMRSLHYASRAAAAAAQESAGDALPVDAWTRAWYGWSSVAFLASYRRTSGDAPFLPKSYEDFGRLLGGCLLEKAIYELRYELNNRPDWVYLPLAALVDLLVE